MNIKDTSRQGMVALSTVLVLGGVLVALATTVTYLSIGEAQSGLAHYKGTENLNLIEGCVEDVLLTIRSNASYNGTTIIHAGQTCTVTYTTGGPTNWDITVSTDTTAYQRKIRVVFVRNSTGITLTSWREI